jgi:hypothetical protein
MMMNLEKLKRLFFSLPSFNEYILQIVNEIANKNPEIDKKKG